MKKNIRYTLGLLLLTILSIHTASAQMLTFRESLDRSGMAFTLPNGFLEVPVVENRSMLYSYAYRDTSSKIEVRYRIDLIDTAASHGNANPNDEKNNALTALTVLMNVSNRTIDIPQLSKGLMTVKPELVKRDFNADQAFIGMVDAGEVFARQYKKCAMTYMHKHNVANVWIFILFNDFVEFKEKAGYATAALKFKE